MSRTETPPTPSLASRQGSWKTRLVALALGCSAIGLLEIGLRLAGVSDGERWSPPQLVTVVQDGSIQGEFELSRSAHFVPETMPNGDSGFRTAEDYRFGRGGGFPAQGCMRDESFSAEPTPGTSRYIVLGGSAAMGQNPSGAGREPWVQVRKTWNVERLRNGVSVLPDASAISGQLERILNEAGHPAEVINAGMIAQDSGAVRDIAEEALDMSPTGLILYLGNNEGIGLSQAMNGLEVPTNWPSVQSTLHHSRIYRLLAGWLLPARQRNEAEETIALQGTQPEVLGRLTLAQWASAGRPLVDDDEPSDDVYRALLARFESNLRSIVASATDQGVQVYVIPTPPHLAYPPFYRTGPGRPWANDPRVSATERDQQAELREVARAAILAEDWAEAERLANESIEIDAYNAEAHHILGRALHELGQTDRAIESLSRAHVLDVSRKRTHPAFARIAEEVCREMGCRTTSAHTSILEMAHSEGLGVYDRLLGDHEHLNPEGNTWIAGLFAELILSED